jgi:hypothetical protein
MSQPKWRFVANLGDANPLNFGGYLVYRDQTRIYPAEAVVIEPNDDEEKKTWTVYRFVLEPCTDKDGVLSDNPYHRDIPVWFAKHLDAMADSSGTTEAELRAAFCSSDLIEQARAYKAIGRYHGWKELDCYPQEFTRTELRRRYPILFPRRKRARS